MLLAPHRPLTVRRRCAAHAVHGRDERGGHTNAAHGGQSVPGAAHRDRRRACDVQRLWQLRNTMNGSRAAGKLEHLNVRAVSQLESNLAALSVRLVSDAMLAASTSRGLQTGLVARIDTLEPVLVGNRGSIAIAHSLHCSCAHMPRRRCSLSARRCAKCCPSFSVQRGMHSPPRCCCRPCRCITSTPTSTHPHKPVIDGPSRSATAAV